MTGPYAFDAVEEGLGNEERQESLPPPESSSLQLLVCSQGKDPLGKEADQNGLWYLVNKHSRYGYRSIAVLLRQKGYPVGKRHVQSLRRSLGLRSASQQEEDTEERHIERGWQRRDSIEAI